LNLCNAGTFHYSQATALAVRYLLTVFQGKKKGNHLFQLGVKAFTFCEVIIVELIDRRINAEMHLM
jgi:hypothetical protein